MQNRRVRPFFSPPKNSLIFKNSSLIQFNSLTQTGRINAFAGNNGLSAVVSISGSRIESNHLKCVCVFMVMKKQSLQQWLLYVF